MRFEPTLLKKWEMKLRHNNQLTKIGWAAGVGVSVGIVAAVLSVHRPAVVSSPTVIPSAYIVPVSSTVPAFAVARNQTEIAGVEGDSQVIERLRTRNRRLEALVTVLRQRAAERH